MNYLVYHDLEKENKHGLTAGEEPLAEGSLMLKEQIIPGMFDYPDMHITHMSLTFKRQQYFIICMTDYELDQAKRVGIIADAVQFLEQRN